MKEFNKRLKRLKRKIKPYLEHPAFWGNLFVSISVPVLGYLGLKQEDINTWGGLWDIIKQAVANPYLIVLIITSIANTFRTTSQPKKGIEEK